jgi:transposase
VIMREVVNGLMYVLSTGCQWRAIPKDLPPKSTTYRSVRRVLGSSESVVIQGWVTLIRGATDVDEQESCAL